MISSLAGPFPAAHHAISLTQRSPKVPILQFQGRCSGPRTAGWAPCYRKSNFLSVISNFRNATLTGADLSGSNLTDASFYNATLTDADLAGAEIHGAYFRSTTDSGFTSAQLYSTASYVAGDLTGIDLRSNDLSGWNFAGQSLTDANFDGAMLTGVDLSGSNLTSADLPRCGTDWRRRTTAQNIDTSRATNSNLIHPAGNVEGLYIGAGEVIRLWDFNGPTPIPILVEDGMSIDAIGTLRAVFEDDQWGSTITFDAGIPVILDGTLELLFDDDANPRKSHWHNLSALRLDRRHADRHVCHDCFSS